MREAATVSTIATWVKQTIVDEMKVSHCGWQHEIQ